MVLLLSQLLIVISSSEQWWIAIEGEIGKSIREGKG